MISLSEIMFTDEPNMEIDRRLLDEDEISRLAALEPLAYDREREAAAEKLSVRVKVLDEAVNKKRKPEVGSCQGSALSFTEVKQWPAPVNGDELLNEMLVVVHRFIICDQATAIAVVLWCSFTWLIDSVQVAPLAIITAPEKRCGKSQLLDLMRRLSFRSLIASNISSSCLFRVIEALKPTLFIDEADSFMRENEEIRCLLNSGHTQQSSFVLRNVGDNHEPKQFSTWGAKALAGIGRLPETLMDRGIELPLRRKLKDETVQRLRHAEAGLFERLVSKLARFSSDGRSVIKNARPELPETLNDRAQDNWEPLLAIADYAGEEWPKLARRAAITLSGAENEPLSTSTELLADIRDIFVRKGVERISTTELLQVLTEDELRPWATFYHGKPITARQLAKRLGEHGIKPRSIRIGTTTPKGFDIRSFHDVFARYLPSLRNSHSQSATPQQNEETPLDSVVLPVAYKSASGVVDIQNATFRTAAMLVCGIVADKSKNLVEVII